MTSSSPSSSTTPTSGASAASCSVWRRQSGRKSRRREKAEKVRHRIPEELRGIGVRIEDDVLVTEGGIDNLTAAVPTEPDDVEALVAEAPRWWRG